MRPYFDIRSSYDNLTINLMCLPIEKETKSPRQAKFHLSLGSTAKTKSLTIYEITRLYSNCSLIFTFVYAHTHHFPRSHKAHTQAHTTYMILKGTRVTIVRIQERSWKKREVERRKLVVHRTWYGLKKVHMLTHGASIQVRSSSGMRLTRRLSLDWPLKASATTVRRGSHLFSRASLLAIVKDENDVASPGCGSLFLSLSLPVAPSRSRTLYPYHHREMVHTERSTLKIFYVRACENVHRTAEFIFRIGDDSTPIGPMLIFTLRPGPLLGQRDAAKWRTDMDENWYSIHFVIKVHLWGSYDF